MSFTKAYIMPQRWKQFDFYTTDASLGNISESVQQSTTWMLGEIRMHMSIANISANDLVVRLSSVKGSAYNIKLLSDPILNSEDVFKHYSNPLLFGSDDQLVITTSTASSANVYGLQVIGWAVTG